MAGYNRLVLMGNLTRDPEYKQLESGQAVCKLGLATNRQFKNRQNGSMIQEVLYIDVDVWGAQAESCRQYLQKGRPVLIEGRLKLDSWQDANGQSRSKHSVVADRVLFLGGSDNGNTDEATESDNVTSSSQVTSSNKGGASRAGFAMNSNGVMPQNPMEQEMFNQIDQIKGRTTAKKTTPAKKSSSNTGELAFTDEPPFEDELPF